MNNIWDVKFYDASGKRFAVVLTRGESENEAILNALDRYPTLAAGSALIEAILNNVN